MSEKIHVGHVHEPTLPVVDPVDRVAVEVELKTPRTEFPIKNLAGVDLSNLSFSAWGLKKAVFAGADAHGTRFFGADLEGADLSGARGISEEQFGGANLFRAKLPTQFEFTGVQHARELAARAERTFLLLVVACATALMISFVREPVHLFHAASPVVVPGIGLQVPLSAFYFLTPIVLLALHLSLSFAVLKLSYALTDLPAVFPNGRAVDQQGPPSTPNFAVLACPHSRFLREPDYLRPAESAPRSSETRMERWLLVFLVWWVVPLTLLGMWWSYLPRRDSVGSLVHGIALVVGVGLALDMHRRVSARFYFRYPDDPKNTTPRVELWLWPFEYKIPLREATAAEPQKDGGRADRKLRPHRQFTIIPLMATAIFGWGLHAISSSAVAGAGCGDASGSQPTWFCEWTSARLEGARLDSLNLQKLKLAGADLESASLRGTLLEEADLRSAKLNEANLTGAQLKDARLWSADLREAMLDHAVLKEDSLQNADLRGASLRFASLNGARLDGAKVNGANLTGAIICGTKFGADVRAGQHGPYIGIPYGGALATPALPDDLTPDDVRTDSTVPAYLQKKKGFDEYQEWRRAWIAIDDLARLPAGTIIERATLAERLRTINLSMANKTQETQDRLVRAIERTPSASAGSDEIIFSRSLREQVIGLRAKVREKAGNHCVRTHPLPPQPQ